MESCQIDLLKILIQLVMGSTPLVLAAIGEVVTEKSGVLNLGLEGMMIIGAVGGFAASVGLGNPFLGTIIGGLSAMGLALLFALFTQIFVTNQVATGLALTLVGLGLAALIGYPYNGMKPPASMRLDMIPGFEDVSLLGASFVLVSFFAVIFVSWFLKKTRAGLVLRAVGENHDAAHAIGYNVIAVRFAAIAFGGFMAGLGGACLSLVRVPQWSEGMTAGIGWIALALVVFGAWRPWFVLLGAYIFGGINVAQLNMQACKVPIQAEYLSMLPYLMTIFVLVLMSLRAKNSNAPANLAQSFVPNS